MKHPPKHSPIHSQERIVPATPETISRAADLIGAGKLAAFPTETVYGLGADATNDKAVAAIFAAKQRPEFNPLIVHLADAGAARKIAQFNGLADELAQLFWPGSLTLVLPGKKQSGISPLVSAGLDTIAVRVPRQPVAAAFIRAAGRPIAAPSANLSGTVSPTSADHVASSLGDKVDMILDAGPCPLGLESTVIDLTEDPPALLRPGGLPVEVIIAAIGPLADAGNPETAPKSPGMSERHYATTVSLRLNADKAEPGEALLSFGADAPRRALNLSRRGDLEEAAANLFAMLRMLDNSGVRGIAVMPIPERGLGRAINDRLRRAAQSANRDANQ